MTEMILAQLSEKMKESELLDACVRGDQAALREIYNLHSRRAYLLALRLTGSQTDAEDIVQEAFLRAFEAMGSFRREAKFSSWLYRIVLNRSRDYLSRRGREGLKKKLSGDQPAPAGTPGDALERRILETALAELPDGMREVLIMHDVLGMGHDEIGRALKVRGGTSKSQLHKAREKLRLRLQSEGVRP